MEIIAQRRTSNTVRREGDRVISEVLWLDGARELVCSIEADIGTLQIQEAWLELLKAPAEEEGWVLVPGQDGIRSGAAQACVPAEEKIVVRRTFPFLMGAAAYIEGKKTIRAHLTEPEDAIPAYLLQQCINGIIQAETYFIRERGFPDEESYNRYWDELEAGGCRMYSHPDPEDLRWMDYAPRRPRRRNLFHRLKSTQIIAAPGWDASVGSARLICRGDFTDSYHEIVLQLTCDAATGAICDADITYLRAPGRACFDNGVHAADLTGRNIYGLTSVDILEAAGRGEGCYHLVEMLKDICMGIRAYAPDGACGDTKGSSL